MKDFLKYTFATVVGILVTGLIIGVIGVMSIIGIVASGEQAKNVSDNSVLVINLSGIIQERTESSILNELTGNKVSGLGYDEIMSAIKKAKKNDNIKGIYIETGAMSADFATLQEIRKALEDFKKSKKWIVAYGDTYTQGTYYLSSVATKVYINPYGDLDWHGLASQNIYVKDFAEKFGVKFQVPKVGRYKSATEMYTEDSMSDANREQTTVFLTGIWNTICNDVSKSRGISVDSLNAYADRMIMFEDQKNYKKYKFVDGFLYSDQVKGEIKKMLKIDEDETISQISVSEMQTVKEERTDGEQIAVYYAYGDIVQNAVSGAAMGGTHNIVAYDVCKDIEDLMNDDEVKAVVIRINSGGGDAYASEQMWHQIAELKKKKPVVVSMGGMAASGAYYMSCASNWIVAQPMTLTGSIGIFGIFPDFSGLITQKLGVKFDEVKTNKNSSFGTMARPMTAEEMNYLTSYINRGYRLFRSRVAEGRKMTVEQVENVAQGRVWLGQDALKIKLIDQLGGLDDAIAKAAKLAKLTEYYTNDYPAPSDWMDNLFAGVSGGNYLDEQMRATLGEYYAPFMTLKNIKNMAAIQARIPYYINIK